MNDKEGRKWLLQKLYNNGVKYIAFSRFYNGYVGMKDKPVFGNNAEPLGDYKGIITLGDLLPDFNKPNYLDIGKYLGIVDWSKVAVDTPITITYNGMKPIKAHFAGYENENIYFFSNGKTSWTQTAKEYTLPRFVQLAGGDDEN